MSMIDVSLKMEEIIRLEQFVISTTTWAQAVKVEECDAQARNTQRKMHLHLRLHLHTSYTAARSRPNLFDPFSHLT